MRETWHPLHPFHLSSAYMSPMYLLWEVLVSQIVDVNKCHVTVSGQSHKILLTFNGVCV